MDRDVGGCGCFGLNIESTLHSLQGSYVEQSPSRNRVVPKHVRATFIHFQSAKNMYHLAKSIYLYATSKEGLLTFPGSPALRAGSDKTNRILHPRPRPRQRW
jgi:hypothetical protein